MNQSITRKIKTISFLIKLILGLVILVLLSPIIYQLNPDFFVKREINPLTWAPKQISTDLEDHPKATLVRMGYDVITKTPELIGPMAAEKMQYAGNNLTCKSCHLEAGTKPGSGSFVGVANRFPQFRGRENKIGTLEERINGCMERSMNGEALPEKSLEMQSMVAYMKWLSEDVPEVLEARFKGFVKVVLPEIKADSAIGRQVYTQHCTVCHGADGQGNRANEKSLYTYPPLWGSHTYNHGAGMHRVITAAEFIKGNMPYLQATIDNPILTDEEAYHVAAYINSFPRPQKGNPEADFPDKTLKPVSTPYGPWEDNFSAEQHKYGPFQPIMAYYQKEYGLKKSK